MEEVGWWKSQLEQFEKVIEILGLQRRFSGDSAEIQRRFSRDSAEIQGCTQQLTKIQNSVVVKGKIRKLEIGVVAVLLGDRDSPSDINEGGSKRLVEITVRAI